MNEVKLIGRVATAMSAKDIGEGRRVADFLLAVERPNGNGADYVRVSVWDRLARTAEATLGKGDRVRVEGRLRSRSWVDAEGRKRSAVDVVGSELAADGEPEGAAGDDIPFGEPVPA